MMEDISQRPRRRLGRAKKQALRQVMLNNGQGVGVEFAMYDEEIGKIVQRLINQTQTPLDRYYFRGQITEDMFKAGNRLRHAFYRAGLSPKVTRSLFGTVGNTYHDLSINEAILQARESFYSALDSVGSELKGILHKVCCLDESAANAVIALKYDAYKFTERDGMGLLRMALLLLSRYYA